ncbi:MAG: hypothetical protein HFJ68_03995 [Adlercreutzia caecimuris]|uniref:hypothetical protein n=1 Tax=Adlercreutzia caecimuris TaxID=671266 RepID=UPI00216F9AE0|nr:hypothetical protein [Adlercreutzia caecimuris]MCI9207704.1 hypothetical protein [Adlercreutzia caecimuris]MCI9673939.1 hypothetical protein [Enterorhabdus sp.]
MDAVDGDGRHIGISGSAMAGTEGVTLDPRRFADLDFPGLVQRNSPGIDKLCAALNGPNAALAQKRAKRRLLEEVLPELSESLPLSAEDLIFRIVFEYASGGILALMAYRAETGFAYPVEAFLQCLTPEVPIALLAVLSEK